MQHSRPTLAFKPLTLLPPTLYFFPLHPHHCFRLLAVFLHLLLPLSPNSLRFLQWNAGGLQAGALNYYSLFCLILLTLSTHLPLAGSLDSLLCDLIVPTPRSGILSADATHASGDVIIFVRQGLSFSELSTCTLSSLDPCSDYVGVTISLTNSSSLSFLNVYAPSIRSSSTDGRTDSFAPSIFFSSRNLFILGDFNCHPPPLGLKRYLRPLWGGSIRLGHFL